jgi:hypothetical protein
MNLLFHSSIHPSFCNKSNKAFQKEKNNKHHSVLVENDKYDARKNFAKWSTVHITEDLTDEADNFTRT